jgi:dTDP-4-amino-4,6-dideoxygalactose transaminase
VHRQQAYRARAQGSGAARALPVTDDVASRVLSLPVYPALDDATVDTVAAVVAAAHEVSAQLSGGASA